MSTEQEPNALLKRADTLIGKYYGEVGYVNAWHDDLDLFKAWLARKQEGVSRQTFLYYRKCLVYLARKEGLEDVAGELADVGRGRPVTTDSTFSLKKTASAEKGDLRSERGLYAEEVPMRAIKIILRELRATRVSGLPAYTHGEEAAILFMATMMTGLRPIEWESARYHEHLRCDYDKVRYQHILSLETAKKKYLPGEKGVEGDGLELVSSETKSRDRSTEALNPVDAWADKVEKGTEEMYFNPDTGRNIRYLILDDFDPGSLRMVRYVQRLASTMDDWPGHYEKLRKVFVYAAKRVAQEIFEATGVYGTITMYTARHIFASEIRRTDAFTPYELAALLGHSDTYNQRYYGDLTGELGRKFEGIPLAKPWPGISGRIRRQERAANLRRR